MIMGRFICTCGEPQMQGQVFVGFTIVGDVWSPRSPIGFAQDAHLQPGCSRVAVSQTGQEMAPSNLPCATRWTADGHCDGLGDRIKHLSCILYPVSLLFLVYSWFIQIFAAHCCINSG